MNNSEKLSKVRNELSYLLRFGGVCSAIQFNPSNISNEASKITISTIINSLNEYMWNKGIDIISTSYANGVSGFMLLTTHSNKEAMKEILSNIDIKKTLKNEYIVSANDILDLSKKNTANLSHLIFNVKIIDNYKMNINNKLSIDLNDNSNISENVKICERTIVSHLRSLNLINEKTDDGLLNVIGNVFKSIGDNSKKYAVPGLLIVTLFYSLNYVYQKWKALGNEKKLKSLEKDIKFELAETSNSKKLKSDHVSWGNSVPEWKSFFKSTSNEPAEPGEPAEPAEPSEPSEPAEPAEPSEPSDFEVNFTTRTVHTNRISTLLKTLEDSEVKHTKTTNIEAKILSLLAETTESR